MKVSARPAARPRLLAIVVQAVQSQSLARGFRFKTLRSSRAFKTLRSRLAAGQPLVLHPPDRQVDAVLAEESFVLEHESRHAPVKARTGQRVHAGSPRLFVSACNLPQHRADDETVKRQDRRKIDPAEQI